MAATVLSSSFPTKVSGGYRGIRSRRRCQLTRSVPGIFLAPETRAASLSPSTIQHPPFPIPARLERTPGPLSRSTDPHVSAVALNIMSHLPLANLPGALFTGFDNFTSDSSAPLVKDAYSPRVDHAFNDNNKLFARASINQTDTGRPLLYGKHSYPPGLSMHRMTTTTAAKPPQTLQTRARRRRF
jgi:hypothetical protein